jgi:peptidoglycan/LPS O-acetylase OafA/YrhL
MSSSVIVAPPDIKVMPALTGIRFVLVGLVVLYHVGVKQVDGAPRWIAAIVSHGYLAVNAFFILSGFVLAHNYLDTGKRLRGGRTKFWIARFARIYPIYALTIILSFSNRFQFGMNQPAGWEDALASFAVFALLQAWIPAYALLIDPAAWSLSAEAFFYFTFPVVSKWAPANTRSGIVRAMGVCWILCLTPPVIFLLTARYAGANLVGFLARDWVSAFLQYNPLFHLPAFVMGIAAQRLFLLESSGSLMGSRRPLAICAISICAICLILSAGWPIPRILVNNGLLGPAFAFLIVGLATGRGLIAGILGHPVLVLLGEASYSLYLLHLPLWGITLGLNERMFRFPDSSWLFLSVDVAIAIGVSILALKYVETPYRISIRAALNSELRIPPPRNTTLIARKENVSAKRQWLDIILVLGFILTAAYAIMPVPISPFFTPIR